MTPITNPLPLPELQHLLSAIITEKIAFFPIRHHSPACAWHLNHFIEERNPHTILIEGPPAFTSLIPLLVDPRSKAPFAIYTSFVNDSPFLKNNPIATLRTASSSIQARHAAWYPFCDFSPELVALRIGAEKGAKLAFIDLNYPEQVATNQYEQEVNPSLPQTESLHAEYHLQRSQYLQALAQRTGCRDHNELWDHLFESRIARGDTHEFIRDVAAWCYMARAHTPQNVLSNDGTLARESAMARAIQMAIAEPSDHTILVVTGGFHTVVLPSLISGSSSIEPTPSSNPHQQSTCLVRYSFEQIDALNGYSAGIPSCNFYDQIWREACAKSHTNPFVATAAKTLVELGRLTRKRQSPSTLSTADEIAALEYAIRLADLRGHPGPLREDLLDSIRSSFVKGALDSNGELFLELARLILTGTAIGDVPPEAGLPPIIQDFHTRAKTLRLDLSTSIARKISLELYRKKSHRNTSRFFHCLNSLEIPFAKFMSGPDFVNGTGLDRLVEHWEWKWTPATESHLLEKSILGSTIQEAAINRLLLRISELTTHGAGQNAQQAILLLIDACRMGLHQHITHLVELIINEIASDPSFDSLVQALNQLLLLWQSREPLEAHYLTTIPRLITHTYNRACYLARDLAHTPPDAAAEALASLTTLHSHTLISDSSENLNPLSSTLHPLIDSDCFWSAIESIPSHPNCPPLLAGGITGLQHASGQLNSAAICSLLNQFLNSATRTPDIQLAFIDGILLTCRELAWREPAIIQAINQLLQTWTDEEFVHRLPHLRLAFAHLTPTETDEVAKAVSKTLGVASIQRPISYTFTEPDMLIATRARAAVLDALRHDGLA